MQDAESHREPCVSHVLMCVGGATVVSVGLRCECACGSGVGVVLVGLR